MEIKLLKKGVVNSEEFYKDFLEDQIMIKEEYFSGDSVYLEYTPDFPIYINVSDDELRTKLYNEAFDTISKYYLHTDRDIHFEEIFWHSLFCVYKRDYLLSEYPEIKEDISFFKRIAVKKFNWESYIYKCVLGAQYVNDKTNDENDIRKYYKLIIDNLDLYNYIIKYEIFRNDCFLINILDIIYDYDLTKVMKAKIKGRDDLGNDERVGRRVIFEFNKSYPVVMSPMLSKEELELLFFEYLGMYYDVSNLNLVESSF